MQKIKILIVEDDAAMREGLTEILKEEGYAITSTDNGEDAIKKFKTDDFQIVLTDLVMLGMDGMDVLREVKQIKPKTHVIMITAFATIGDAVEAIKKGAADYIPKPFKEDEVQVTIKKVLEEARVKEKSEIAPLSSLLNNSMIKCLSNPLRKNIIELLYKHKKARFSDILKEFDLGCAPMLSFHLKRLKSTGLIIQNEERIYLLSSRGEEIAKALKYQDI